MGFNTYRRMTVAELRNILAQAIEILDDYPDDTKIIERVNTYGCPTPYLSTPKGFYPLNDLEFEDVEESKLEKKGYVIKEDDEDSEYDKMFKRIFPFAAINDEQAYDFMYNIGKIVKKWLDKDVDGDCFFLLRTILKKILRYGFGSDSDRSWDWILNKIDETIMRYFDDEDLGTRCMREVMDFIDGWM